ncbi:MAG: hypothetical protein AAF391_06425 [Bacteroidota bacterium]
MNTDQQQTRIVNHKFLRKITGITALLMPFLVQFLSGRPWEIESISESYWTDSGDLFVGSLAAIAFFLASYNGTGECKRDKEYWISRVAGFFALLVALIPTACLVNCYTPEPGWVTAITGGYSSTFHNVAAVSLFVCLFALISFFARRAKFKGKTGRSKFYTIISLGMVIGMPLLYFIGRGWDDILYWVEVLGLLLFGVGWLAAGSYRSETSGIPKQAKEFGKITVDAKNKNNASGLQVKAGKEYLFVAKGCWKDAFLSSGPTGWGPDWKWWTKKNRLVGHPIFMVCGNVGKDDQHAFNIGERRVWTAPNSVGSLPNKELYLFANDWRNKYQNNSGSLEVTIYEL